MAPKTPIGKMLVERQKIDQVQLGDALEHQRKFGGRLASNLLELGLAGENDLLVALGEQIGVPAVDLSRSIIPLNLLELVPEQVAGDAHILPLRAEGDRLWLAMANPEDQKVIDEVTFISGKSVEPYVVLEARLGAVVRECYALHKRDPNAAFYRGGQASFPDDQEDPQGLIMVISQKLPEPDVTIDVDDGLISIEVGSEEGAEDSSSFEVTEEAPVPDNAPLILVVDDEEDIVRLIEKALLAEGFRVLSASRGLEALQAVKTHQPRLILLDAMLPEIHGFEICKKIKSSKRFGHIPIVMISAVYKGWRYAQDVKEAYGADDYFEKPFHIIPLVRRVRELLHAGPPISEKPADPETANHSYQQGVSLYRDKRYDEADAALREACQLDPFNATIHYALANVLMAKNKVFDAIREYENTIELKPDLFAPLRNLAILYQKKGFRNKAVEMWERALRCSPEGEMRRQVREQLFKLF